MPLLLEPATNARTLILRLWRAPGDENWRGYALCVPGGAQTVLLLPPDAEGAAQRLAEALLPLLAAPLTPPPSDGGPP